jgi:gas vesicle protein
MSKTNNWIMGAIIGGVVGSVLATLYAPYSGLELRTRIKDYIQNVQDEVQQAGNERRLELEAELERLRSGEE